MTQTKTLGLATAQKPAENKPKRQQFFGVFIGTNRTGKSSTAKQYALAWKKHNPNRPIMALDPQGVFDDILSVSIELDNNDWDSQICELRNGLLILDDYRLIQENGTAKPGLRRLMAYRAKWNVDIIIICHSPALVLLFLTPFVTHYYIFRTQALDNSFSTRIPNAANCIKAVKLINEYVKQAPAADWPKFPHIIVNNQKEEVYFQNINKAIISKILLSQPF